ncbi:helix-turn-helix domain-containing protein [Domibacillus epiphyticus]|uniref:helix-turn-helix domain-containing protein n=1 Tax=Domibacillus epiphyticus TaxID=1714355 RepID=UPI0009FB3E97|nr:helix-turn-helix domain-containing protein [Domibacillus epiphyticus]
MNAIKAVEGERTSSSVYHLLKGKKSAQTIQDAHLYRLTKWFHTAPFLTSDTFETMMNNLMRNTYIAGDLHRPFVTKEGLERMNGCFSETGSFPDLSGWQFSGTASVFFSRLQLLVQVASHLAYRDSSYYPITRDETLHEWVRRFLRKAPCSKEELASSLFMELDYLFQLLPEQPECIVIRFSGQGQTGKTVMQAAEWMKMEETEYWFRFLHALHSMVRKVTESPHKTPLLQMIVSDIYNPVTLTSSARQTAEYLKKGMTIDQIAPARRLKKATIEDHVVELALNDPSFSIRPFIDKEKEDAVLKVAEVLSNRQLKPIKEKLPEHSYFQIRLVLAKESRNTI